MFAGWIQMMMMPPVDFSAFSMRYFLRNNKFCSKWELYFPSKRVCFQIQGSSASPCLFLVKALLLVWAAVNHSNEYRRKKCNLRPVYRFPRSTANLSPKSPIRAPLDSKSTIVPSQNYTGKKRAGAGVRLTYNRNCFRTNQKPDSCVTRRGVRLSLHFASPSNYEWDKRDELCVIFTR